MARMRLPLLPGFLLALGLFAPGQVASEELDSLEPYKMLRSLQFVQDSVVLGDHSAAEMQRFMLETIDQRLRTADPSVFDELRNVDAALVYAMSGGNPATLDYLVARDVNGNFDSRVSDALRKYLSGKGTLIAKSLGDMVPEYRDTRIAPYLALVAGNVTITRDPVAALKFYDWARLVAPGTIVEEAALRRSISVAVDAKLADKALQYSQRYARRFLHSPYASQFADLFVQLAVEHYEHLGQDAIVDTLASMDTDRKREVYLRIARKAAIVGKNDLARLAADNAKGLAGLPNDNLAALADLYGGLANIPTSQVADVMQAIADIPDEMLSPSDRALRSAAEAVAREVLSAPDPASLAQDEMLIPNKEDSGEDVQEPAQAAGQPMEPKAVAQTAAPADGTPDMNPEFKSFVENGRSKLEAIDSLLKEEGTSQ